MKSPSPPAWFILCLVAMEVLTVVLPGPRWLARPWTLLGLIPLGAGMALHAWASRTFLRAGTTIEPEGRPAALVRAGPYAHTRNPMYLAGVPILLGAATVLGTTSPLAVVVLYGLGASRWVSREESRLGERFGSEWDAYRGAVRRWL